MTKKILSMLMALSMVLAMLAACNNQPVEDVENSKDQQEDTNSDENQGGEEAVLPETLDIVVDGLSEYVIVRGENAYISEITAATELQSYLKKMTGFEIPIVTDITEPTEKEIVVGKTNRESEGEFDRKELGDEGFIIKTEGSKLYLVGGELRGTLYSVYEFLEAYLGCGFYTSEVEKIPVTKTISLDQIEEDKQIPVFVYRETDWYNSETVTNNIRVKHRINGSMISDEYGGCFGNYLGFILWCHTFQTLVPPSKYFAEHPEYYAMDENGNRTGGEYGNAGLDSQLCLSNPEVTQVLIEETRSFLKNYSDDPKGYFSLSINDNRNYCRCPECEAIYAADNNTTDMHLRVVNAVATALKDEFPNVTFEFLSYFHTRPVPTSVKAAENVVVRMAFIEECFSHPLEECTEPAEGDSGVKAAIEIKEWAKFTDQIFIWDYTCNYDNYPAPFPNMDTLLKNERYYADHNVTGIFHEGPGGGGANAGEFSDLRIYLQAKVLWDPYMTEEEYNSYINEFLEGVYGPGWTHIREYFDLMHDVTADVHFGCFESDMSDIFDLGKAQEMHKQKEFPEDLTADMIRNYEAVDWTKYWNFFRDIPGDAPSIISEGERLFALAMEQAETDLQKKYIDKSYTQVEYLKSFYIGKKLGYGGSALGKIVLNFFKANPDEFTQQEQDDFRMAIVKLAREQAYGSYAAYNRALAEKLISYGINYVIINNYLTDLDAVNFETTPDNWFD